MDWNHIAVSVRNRTLLLHVNGAQVSSLVLNTTFLARTDFCVLGNSQTLRDPFTMQIRHLTFSKVAFTNITFNEVHTAP